MAETLEQFVVRRRRELDEDAKRLQSEMDALQAERDRIDKVAAMIGDRIREAEATNDAVEALLRNPRRMSEGTIKTMVLNILRPPSEGMTALEILALINRDVEVPYPRTSLSPQLSRLKADGKIHREGRVWKFGPAIDVDDKGQEPSAAASERD